MYKQVTGEHIGIEGYLTKQKVIIEDEHYYRDLIERRHSNETQVQVKKVCQKGPFLWPEIQLPHL